MNETSKNPKQDYKTAYANYRIAARVTGHYDKTCAMGQAKNKKSEINSTIDFAAWITWDRKNHVYNTHYTNLIRDYKAGKMPKKFSGLISPKQAFRNACIHIYNSHMFRQMEWKALDKLIHG